MAITDLITLFISACLLKRGASRGFMNSLLGPLSLIVATIASIVYFQQTKQMVISLTIGLIGPFVLHLVLKILLRSWSVATNTNIKPDFLSCLGGAILTMAWGWVFIILTLIMLSVIPPLGKALTALRADILRSKSYAIAKPVEDTFFADSKKNIIPGINPNLAQNAKSITDDPRFQSVMQDPEVQKEIDARDFGKLMSNPKIMDLTRQLMSDPVALKKIMDFYKNNPMKLPPVLDHQTGRSADQSQEISSS